MTHISYSELKEWTDCPWKHKLNYIDKIKQFKGNEHTAFGSALHTVCEVVVQDFDENKKSPAGKSFLHEGYTCRCCQTQCISESSPQVRHPLASVGEHSTAKPGGLSRAQDITILGITEVNAFLLAI